MKSLELKWGIIIGLAGTVWLYFSCYMGMHSNGMGQIQVMTLIGIGISLLGYIFGLKAIKKQEPELEYLEGVKSGAIIAGIEAAIAVVKQVGYFKFVNPGWTEYMVGETKLHYEKLGASKVELEEHVVAAWKLFSFKNYMFQSALTAVVLGIIFSAIIMLFLKGRKHYT